MKIGLMTWHHTQNYGTVFQAFALKEVLQSLGNEVDLIDYRRKYNEPIKQRNIKSLFESKFKNRNTSQQNSVNVYSMVHNGFEEFYERYFSYSIHCEYNDDFEKINQIYDCFVCGSDQIWGPEWLDGRFYLDFVEGKERKIAYAASFGVQTINDNDIKRIIKKYIEDFSYVSIRETNGQNLAVQLSGNNAIKTVLDPVFLLSSKEWEEFVDEDNVKMSGYMLIFFLKNNEENIKLCLDRAKQLSLEPIILHCTQSEDTVYANMDNPYPKEWLSLIKNATYICTDSFHMTAFSIIFNIQFEAFNKDNKNTGLSKNNRVYDLLDKLGIDNHIYNGRWGSNIDYKVVNEKISCLRSDAFAFLENALKNVGANSLSKKCNKNCNNQTNYCNGKRANCETSKCGFIKKRMSIWNFDLMDSCYSCGFLRKSPECIYQKPVFYDRLLDDEKMKKSTIYLYFKYYLLYDIPKILREIKTKLKI